MNHCPTVSVIATVYNEAANVGDWLAALLTQSRRPDEIVIVDGGSTDGTVSEIERRRVPSSVPIRLVLSPGASISLGRNMAIARASGDLIAVTDAGTEADPRWLERLVRPLIAGEADVASGFFAPRLSSRWDRALAATTLPDAGEITPQRFQPSSRSMAFHRYWFVAGVRYPEWLDYCEDLVWDLAMRRAGARFAFVPDARVVFAVRPTPAAFALQYWRYARGDGKAGLFARRHGLRYATYAILLAVLARRRNAELAPLALFGAAYLRGPLSRLWRRDRALGLAVRETATALPLVVALRAIGDIAKMAGYPAGLVWRWRRYGGIDWRTSWQRISPAGDLFRPARLSRGSRPPEASPADESRAGSR